MEKHEKYRDHDSLWFHYIRATIVSISQIRIFYLWSWMDTVQHLGSAISKAFAHYFTD